MHRLAHSRVDNVLECLSAEAKARITDVLEELELDLEMPRKGVDLMLT